MSPEDSPNGKKSYDLIGKLYPGKRVWEVWKASRDDQQLDALAEIRSKNLRWCLPYLAPLACNGSAAVRLESAKVISYLLRSDPVEGIGFLSAGISQLVRDFPPAADSLNEIKRDTVWNLKTPSADEWAVFGLLSFHGNGWIRESALDRLGKIVDGSEIPFLLFRSNDWVGLIAGKARDFLNARLLERPIRQFSVHLPIVFQLRSRQRG